MTQSEFLEFYKRETEKLRNKCNQKIDGFTGLDFWNFCKNAHPNDKCEIHEIVIPGYRRPLDVNIAAQHYNKINALVPGYFRHYGISVQDLCYPLFKPDQKNVIRQDRKNNKSARNRPGLGYGVKYQSHIIEYIKRYNVRSVKYSELNKAFQYLGELWNSCNNKDNNKIYFKLSNQPEDFFKLGLSGFDGRSCFKWGGCNEGHKYILAFSSDTYCGYFSHNKEAFSNIKLNFEETFGQSYDNEIIGRCWMIQTDPKTVHFANFYKNSGLTDACLDYCSRYIAGEMIGEKVENVTKSINLYNIEDERVFLNKDKRYTFTASKNPPICYVTMPETKHSLDIFYCSRCERWKRESVHGKNNYGSSGKDFICDKH